MAFQCKKLARAIYQLCFKEVSGTIQNMPSQEQNQERVTQPLPIEISQENTFYVPESYQLIDSAAHTTIEGNVHYGAVIARRAYQQEHQADIYQGRNASILFFNPGHGQALFDAGIIDESNVFRIVNTKTNESTVVAAVPVGQLLEMTVWLTHHQIALPERLQSMAQTWYGFVANVIFNELGQGSIKNQVDLIKRRLRPEVIQRKLQDRRRTQASVVREALKLFYPKQARNKFLIEAAKNFLAELTSLQQKQPNIVNFDSDQKIIDNLQERIALMEQDLHESQKPAYPPDSSSNP